VESMNNSFRSARNFNQPLSNWDVSKVTNFTGMFEHALSFNQDISDWNISSVTRTWAMFHDAYAFNQDISQWNLSSVRTMEIMFKNARSFNQDIGSWDTSSVTDMNGTFKGAIAFDQDISDWNVSSVTNFAESFANTDSLADSNKGLIHESFYSNPNWPYDWSEFVADSNSSHSDDHNQTQPSQPELFVLAPMVATYGHQRDVNGTITLYGKITSDGNATIEQAGFNIRISMDGNDTVLLTNNLSIDGSFSITFSSKDSFYFQAFAHNEKGETKGTWKRVGATLQSYPIDGMVETGDGWLISDWFGEFRYFENGWAYHYGLGWVYLSTDREDGMWLWRKEHGWLWSNQSTWPFLWSHANGDWIYLLIREEQDPVFFDYSTGRYSAEND
jgi:surface protein